MMKKIINKNQDALIDKYYNEDFDKRCIDNDKFNNELNESLCKMKVIQDIDCDMDINISEIIESAETIKYKRKKVIENIVFMVVSIAMLAIFTFTAVFKGMKFIIIYEMAIVTLMPFVLIPISMMEVKGGSRYVRK